MFADGRIVFSEMWSWSTTMFEAKFGAAPTMAITLDATDPRRPAIAALAAATLRALPTPGATAFHIEFFDAAAGIVVNEAASRIGGGRIQPTLRRLHGVDLVELTARYQGDSSPGTIVPHRAAPTAGFLLAYDHAGLRGPAPAECPLPGISHYETVLPLATGPTPEVASSAYLLSGIALGDSREETEQRLLALYGWFVDSLTSVER